jgi:SAM-dependent methyltransferase
MSLDWMDVTDLSFNSLLLLERVQLSWFPGWLPEKELAIALQANPVVAWYLRHKCPEIEPWVESVAAQAPEPLPSPEAVRQAEQRVLGSIEDLLVYAVDPERYDAQPFLGWDSSELSSLVDFRGKDVIDVGSGTGRLALVAAPLAHAVYAVEPVGNLRRYLREKFQKLGYANVYPIDGLITEMPFPPAFADVTMSGHVFGDPLEQEYQELQRVTRPGGMVILCPGSGASENAAHDFLVAKGFKFTWFEEPRDGMKRKYWKTV